MLHIFASTHGILSQTRMTTKHGQYKNMVYEQLGDKNLFLLRARVYTQMSPCIHI